MCNVSKMKLHIRCKTPENPAFVFIVWNGEQVGVCEMCWKRIADKDWECGDSPKPTMEEIFSDKARFGENPVETEIKLKGKKIESSNEEEENF